MSDVLSSYEKSCGNFGFKSKYIPSTMYSIARMIREPVVCNRLNSSENQFYFGIFLEKTAYINYIHTYVNFSNERIIEMYFKYISHIGKKNI